MEKEVLIFDSTPSVEADPSAMHVEWDQPSTPTAPPMAEQRVFKVIKKLDVQILCAQHNPVRLTALGTRAYNRLLIFSCLGCRSFEESLETGEDQAGTPSSTSLLADQDSRQLWRF